MKKTNKLFKVLIAIGILILIGTAGASDSEILNVKQTLLQILFSAILILLGAIGNFCILQLKRRKKKKVTFFTEVAA